MLFLHAEHIGEGVCLLVEVGQIPPAGEGVITGPLHRFDLEPLILAADPDAGVPIG